MKNILIVLVAFLMLLACEVALTEDVIAEANELFNDENWQLVFEDEFAGTAIDTDKWNVSTGAGFAAATSWGKTSQAYVKDGKLIMPLTIFEGDKEADNFGKEFRGYY